MHVTRTREILQNIAQSDECIARGKYYLICRETFWQISKVKVTVYKWYIKQKN